MILLKAQVDETIKRDERFSQVLILGYELGATV